MGEDYPSSFLQEVYDVINVVDHSIRLTVALAGLAMAGVSPVFYHLLDVIKRAGF